MLQHGSSLRRPEEVWRWLLLLSCLVLAACGRPGGAASGAYLIDTLVRSEALEGVDLHLRYAEREGDRLTLHLAFYNNSQADLAQVQGIDPRAVRLAGAPSEAPANVSASLENGIVPAGGWLSGGATNGTLTFDAGPGQAWSLSVPGFPPVPFRLDTPLRTAPEPAVPAVTRFRPGYEVESPDEPGATLRIEVVEVSEDALNLTIVAGDPAADDASEATIAAARLAVAFDARWNQYRSTPDPAITPDLAPDMHDIPEEAVTVRFSRPLGNAVLLSVPGFPLLRVPLRSGEPVGLATSLDLPPSTEARVPPVPTEIAPQVAAVSEMFASLNHALAQWNREQYLEHFIPGLREAQGELFDRLQELPLDEVLLQPRTGDLLAATLDENTLPQQLGVTWSYHLREAAPDAHLSFDAELSVHRVRGRLQIGAIKGQEPFWALGPTEVEQAGAFWIFFRPEARTRLARTKDDLAAALEEVERRLPGRMTSVQVMFVTETPEEFAALTGRDPRRFSGLALSRYRIGRREITTTESTFYINGATFHGLSESERRQTLVHELTHLVLAPSTTPFTPVWLVEGVAMEVAGDLPAAAMRTQVDAGALDAFRMISFTEQASFGLLDPDGAQADYAFAAYLARYLVEQYGFDGLVEFYDSFSAVPVAAIRDDLSLAGEAVAEGQTLGPLAAKITPELVYEAFDLEFATLERDFLKWLRQQPS